MITASVFIVTQNSAPYLRACLESLRAQSLGDFELIVVDNASSDNTVDLIRHAYPEAQVLANNYNLGFANAHNLALTLARGRYVILLDPSAALPPDLLQSAVKSMEKVLDAGIGGALLQDRHGQTLLSAQLFPSLFNEILALADLSASHFWGRFVRFGANPAEAAAVDCLPCGFTILRRSLLTEIRLFDSRFFMYYGMVDLCRRIHDADFKVYYWPELQVTLLGDARAGTRVDGDKLLALWRMRSQLLYYQKWHGVLYAQLVKALAQSCYRFKAWRNGRRAPNAAAEARLMVQLWRQAWQETKGGLISPPQPW